MTCIKPCIPKFPKLSWNKHYGVFFMEEILFFIKEHYGVSLCNFCSQSSNRKLSRKYHNSSLGKNQSLPFVFFDSLGIVPSLGESIQVLVYSERLKILPNENALFSNLSNYHKDLISSWFYQSFSKQGSELGRRRIIVYFFPSLEILGLVI